MGDRTAEVLSWGERKQKLFFGRDYPILGLGSKFLLWLMRDHVMWRFNKGDKKAHTIILSHYFTPHHPKVGQGAKKQHAKYNVGRVVIVIVAINSLWSFNNLGTIGYF